MSQIVTDENGQPHEFPDDATPEEMNRALSGRPLSRTGERLQAATMAGLPLTIPGVSGTTYAGGPLLGRSPQEGRERLGALPWVAGAAALVPLLAVGSPLALALGLPLAGMAGREGQLRLGGDVPVEPMEHGKSLARAGASVGLNLGLPEMVARAPGMVASRAERAIEKQTERRAAEAIARSNANVAARTSVAPDVRAAAEKALQARRAAGEKVGEAVSAAAPGAPPITSREIADIIADSREAVTRKKISEQARQLIQKDVERTWIKTANSMPGSIDIRGIQPKSRLLEPGGIKASLGPQPPIEMDLEDAHIVHRVLDKRARVASKAGKSTIADLMYDIANAQREAIARRGGEPLAEANKAFSQAARTQKRLSAAADRLPTPQEVELRRTASARAADAMARVPTDEPLISWHGGNIVTGKVPFPRSTGPRATLRMASNPRVETAAGSLAGLMRLAGYPLTSAPQNEEQRLVGAYRGREAELIALQQSALKRGDRDSAALLQRVLDQLQAPAPAGSP